MYLGVFWDFGIFVNILESGMVTFWGVIFGFKKNFLELELSHFIIIWWVKKAEEKID